MPFRFRGQWEGKFWGGVCRNLPFLSSQIRQTRDEVFTSGASNASGSTKHYCFGLLLFFLVDFYCCFLYKFSSFFIRWKLFWFVPVFISLYNRVIFVSCFSFLAFCSVFRFLVVKRLLRFFNGRLHSLLLNVTRDRKSVV